MSENILTEPGLQNDEYILLAPRSVILGAAVWVKICDVQVQRASMTIVPGNWSDPMFLAPDQSGTFGLIPAGTVTFPYQIHGAQWPLQILGIWYMYSGAGQTVRVYEILRIKG